MPTRRDFTKTSLAAFGALAFPRLAARAQPALAVDGPRLNANLAALAEFGKNSYGGVSRVAYSDHDANGRAFAMQLMRAAQLDVQVDLAGNIVGRRAGKNSRLKPIIFGSHIDSVPDGGNYDGTVGSLSSIEAARLLGERGIVTEHPLEVVIFQNEEGGTVGSRAWVGELHAKDFELITKSGKTIRDGIAFIGGDPTKLDRVLRQPGSVAAYLELHIEQGGNLDKEKLDIGVVEGIVGIGWWDVTIEGFANHAGTTPMNARRDAMLAAARFTEMVNRTVTSMPGRQVGTVGRIQAFPGAPNVIPGKVLCSLELRDLDNAKIAALFATVQEEARAIGAATGTTFAFVSTHASKSALCDARIQKAVEGTAQRFRMSTRYLPSGAGHDAQHMARLGPSGMIFVPSVSGISHAPNEFSKPQDIVNGANVLLHTLLELDRAPWT